MSTYIINGKRYDTKKAELLGEDSYSNPSDFHHWQESLYRTPKGAFFIVGVGGPLSRWAVSTGQNETSGGEGARAIDRAEALEWIERARIAPEDLPECLTSEIEEA